MSPRFGLTTHEDSSIWPIDDGLWILQLHSAADRAAQEKEFQEMLKNAMTP
jgi:hypothetical protein